MAGWSTILSYIFSFGLTFIVTKFGQKYVWGNKKEDGTDKSPWAPKPNNNMSFWTGGYQAFEKDGYRAFTQWSKQLGDFFSVEIGFQRFQVLNSLELVEDALVVKEQLNSSRYLLGFEKFMTQSKTIFAAPFTSYWSRLRRAVYIVVGKMYADQYTDYFHDQAKKLSLGIQKTSLTAKELRQLTDVISMDTALRFVFGPDTSRDPVMMLTLIQQVQALESIQSTKYNRMAQFIPLVQVVLDLKNILTLNANVIKLRDSLVDIVMPWLQDNNHPKTDAILTSLQDIEPSKNDPEPIQLKKNETIINSIHITLHAYTFLSSTLFTLIQRLASDPQLQQRLAENLSDRALFSAVVNESLRIDPPQALLTYGPRTDYEYQVNDKTYRVDQDTPIVVNVDAIHHQERYFPDPEKFNPDRFLDNNNNKSHLAFGAGRRVCIASQISQDYLVSMLMHLVQHYQLKGGDVSKKDEKATSIWSWVGRTETQGDTIEFIIMN